MIKILSRCFKGVLISLGFIVLVINASGQTNPTAVAVPYSQNFSGLASTSSTLPSEWGGWNLSATGPTTVFPNNAPPAASDLSMTPSATASTTVLGLMNYNGKIGFLSGSTSNSSIVLALTTTNVFNISVAFDIMTIRNPFDVTNTRIEQVDLQFRVGTIGVFSTVSGLASGIYQNTSVNQTGAVTTPQSNLVKTFTLPAACNNKPVVQLRWVSRDVSGLNNRPSFAIDNVVVCSAIATPSINISGPSGACSGNISFYSAAITNGGTVPVYQWKKNGTIAGTNSASFAASGLIAGDQITCQLTSNAACVSTNVVTSAPITISTVNSPPTIVLNSLSHVSCPNAKNGAIDISVSGGSPPYTIAWDTINIVNGPVFGVTVGLKTPANPLFGQGSLSAFIVDGVEDKELVLTRGITYSFNVLTPSHPFQISSDLTGGNANFIVTNGQTGAPTQNGVVSFKANNSHPSLLYYPCQFHAFMGYKVNISNGLVSEDVNNLKPGLYNVVATDANGCSAIAQYQINELPSPVSLSASTANSLCGTASGSIDLTISGGVPPYSVIWDTLNTVDGTTFSVMVGAKTISNPYFVLGYPSAFFINSEESKQLNLVRGISYSFNVFNPGHPFHISTDSIGGSSLGIITLGQAGAPNDNGLISYTPSILSPSNLYYICANHLYMGSKINLFGGLNAEDLSALIPGTYTVAVTDALGCMAQQSFVVSDDPSPVTIVTNYTTGTSCTTSNDGVIDISVMGAASPFTINWDTVNVNNGGVFGVMAGMKTIANSYFGMGSPECFYIDGIEAPTITLTRGINYLFNVYSPGHTWHISNDNVGGNTSGLVINGQSGGPNDNGTVLFTPNSSHASAINYVCGIHEYMGMGINIIDGPSDTHMSNLHSGTYSVVVTDVNGCSALQAIVVDPGALPCVLNLNLKFFLQAMYMGAGSMSPKLYDLGLSSDVTATDSVVVELRDSTDFSVVASVSDIVHTNGMMSISLPTSVLGSSYYIVVRQMNSIETWSKEPVPFFVSPVSFDFSN